MAEAGTWRKGRADPIPEPRPSPPPQSDVRRPTSDAAASRRTSDLRLRLAALGRLPALRLSAYVVCAGAGSLAGLAVAAAILALAGRTLFDVPTPTAQVFLVAAPLLSLLPLSFLLLLASARPALLPHLSRLLALWGALAALLAFWFGVRPFLP